MSHVVRSLLTLSLLAIFGAAVPSAAAQDSAHAPGSPSGIGVEMLFEAVFPAETIPTENPRIYFVRQRYLPGVIFGRPSVPSAEYVVAGSLAVRSAGRVIVQRHSPPGPPPPERGVSPPSPPPPEGGVSPPSPPPPEGGVSPGTSHTAEELAPGSEATVGAGDVAVYLSNGAPQTVHNPGTTPALTLKVIVITASAAASALPRSVAPYILGHLSTFDWQRSALPVGPLRVRVERLTAAPGVAIPPSTTELPILRFVEAGELAWAIETPATRLAPMLAEVRYRRGQAVPYQRHPDGSSLLLRSSGDEPLVLLELSTMPAAE